MEWLKRKNLKQSFFIITALFLSIGILLSAISFFICMKIRTNFPVFPQYEIFLNDNKAQISYSEKEDESIKEYQNSHIYQSMDDILTILQFILPVFWIILSLLLADIIFYNIKIKQPLSVLQTGALRIQHQDLDFIMKPLSKDELGQLCESFEIMRKELWHNNRELWRQMEERKRLNAAFSHDLRNPVTVLKGSAKMLQKGMEQGISDSKMIKDSIALITQYTNRIETYIEAMTNAQKLEELECKPILCEKSVLQEELENSLKILAASFQKQLIISCFGEEKQVQIDKQFFYNITENLVNNALRYANSTVTVELIYQKNQIILFVMDDGSGFPSLLLQKGPTPFLRDDTAGNEHFGMGLYICKLLCEKHGGSLLLENTESGGRASAVLKNYKFLSIY